MSSSGAERAKELFLDALEREGAERQEFLHAIEASQPRLAERVRQLLAAHEGANRVGIDLPSEVPGATLAPGAGARVGDYEILNALASGGAGVVYRARQLSLGRVVALKLLRAGRLAADKEVERFRAEAEAVARLDHPHIVPVYEVGEHEGRHFFSMKLVEGGSLAQHLHRYAGRPRAAARLLAIVARAVHHAHQRGILHRDLKPSNVLLDEHDAPYVADFGVAKRIDADARATGTEWLVGTPAYMAPEQATPGAGELTVGTDVWALGCILYELLAGRAPFDAQGLSQILAAVRQARPPALPADVSRDLATITMTCLEKDPARRYPSANALADDLERWLNHEPVQARPVSTLERARLWWQRRPLVASLVALVAVLVVALALGGSWASVELSDRLRRARSAEQAANERLRNAYLAQARALRFSGRPGRRTESLERLEQAAAIRPGADLRDEAIACLALFDLERVLVEPLDRSRTLALAFDGRLERIAGGDARATLRLRHLGAPDETRVSEGLDSSPRFLRFSPGGRWLAYCHGDGSAGQVLVLDAASGRVACRLDETLVSQALCFTPDDERVAIGTLGDELVTFEVPSGRELVRVALSGRPLSLACRPGREQLAVGLFGTDRAELRDLATGALLQVFPHATNVFSVAWSADGSTLATACGDFNGYLWDVADDLEPLIETQPVEDGPDAGVITERPAPRTTLRGHQAEVVRIAVSASLPVVATTGWDESTRLWDLVTGGLLLTVSARLNDFSTDGRRVALTTNDELGVWELLGGKFQRSLQTPHAGKSPRELAVSPDGTRLVTIGGDGAFLWDLERETLLGRLGEQAVERCLFHPRDGRVLLSGREGLLEFAADALRAAPFEPTLRRIQDGCDAASLDATGRLLALRHQGALRLIDLASGETLGAMPEKASLSGLTMSPDGRWLATGSWHGHGVHVWSAERLAYETELEPEASATVAQFSPDSRWLATSTGQRVRLWRAGTWALQLELPRGAELATLPGALAFDRDGGQLAYTWSHTDLRIVRVPGGELVATLVAPDPQPLTGLAFTPDARRLLGGTGTHRIQVWDLARMQSELRSRGLSLEK